MRRFCGIVFLPCVSITLFGQSPTPSFEVVSIKEMPEATGIAITPRRSGNRITYATEVRMMVYYAYRVQPFQVSGDLVDGVYNVEAVLDAPADDAQLRRLFQTLLADRFHLKLHRETRTMPVYSLLEAKSGSKLKPSEGKELVVDGRPVPDGVGTWATAAGPRFLGRRASMAELADGLARTFHSPVLDRTGLTGTFDWDIRFGKDVAPGAGSDSFDMAAALRAALQKELGLRVEAGKGPVEILVIDHVEPPTAN